MEEFNVLSLKEIKKLSPEEIKKYYKEREDFLKSQLKINLRDKAEIEKAEKNKNKTKINHAMFLVAGELFKSEYAVKFLSELASKTRFTARHTDDLNLLMKSKGLDKIVKFTPCLEPKKDMDNSKSKDDATSAEQKDEKAPEEPKSVETPTESKA